MKRLVSSSILIPLVLLAGCTHFKSKPAAPISAGAPAPAIISPDLSLAGKVVSHNSVGRFVVLNFSTSQMPKTNSRLFLYRAGLKVAEVKITGPQSEGNTVADIISGDAQVGDEVRDR